MTNSRAARFTTSLYNFAMPMPRRGLVIALLWMAPLFADDAVKRARKAYDSALAHYHLGEYKEALDDFKSAYRLKHEPDLLFNIAQAMRQLGDFDGAAREYRAYLRERPGAANRA